MNSNNNIVATQQIILFGIPNLQNSILVGHVQQQVGVNCRYERRLLWLKEWDNSLRKMLILIDAELCNHDKIFTFLDALHGSQADIRIGFYGVSKVHPAEKFIAWPLVHGIFYHDISQQQFFRGIEKIFNGEYWLPRQLLAAYLQHTRKKPKILSGNNTKLTKRELQILQLAATGASNVDIASSLNLSSHTVKTHFYNLFKKINAVNRMQAVIWARDHLHLHNEILF